MKRFITAFSILFFTVIASNITNAQDWANLNRFNKVNSELGPPNPAENRIVFMGNSITEAWGNICPDFFKDKPYINRGISGQTTPQMLVRFRQDVIQLKPVVVLILAGTNDIAGNTGPMTLEMIMDNIISMAEVARANNIEVILCSVIPAYDFPWSPGLEPAEKIIDLNSMIQTYAEKKHIIYLDYFSDLVDDRNGLRKAYSEDGVHPNKKGYQVMGPLAEKAISIALRSKQ